MQTEIDTLVAKYMGTEKFTDEADTNLYQPYSTDYDAAFQVAEKIKLDKGAFCLESLGDEWACGYDLKVRDYWVRAETAQKAICLAFLNLYAPEGATKAYVNPDLDQNRTKTQSAAGFNVGTQVGQQNGRS